MSSIDTTTKRSAPSRETLVDTYELADQLVQIREELQRLTSTVSRIAGKQLGRAQDTVKETADQVDTAIRQNPVSALAIAAALGFLFGVFTRR
jgi:ElaB/YqjD/DUF883 family membrane-anchored ribosome-binding protein